MKFLFEFLKLIFYYQDVNFIVGKFVYKSNIYEIIAIEMIFLFSL